MKIKTDGTSTYVLSPEETKQFFGIETNKIVLIDKKSMEFIIEDGSKMISNGKWTDEEVDGRKFRKVKKNIVAEFGNILLREYKTTNKVYETLSKKFINTSGISEVFKNALSNDMNLVVYGKGGFGKSEMCDALFNVAELKDRVFIKSLSEATTEEDLFGGINMKKMTDEGIIEYNCHNSFANKEIVIFEEIFDANPRVLAALKDTLTSKEIRNGNQRFPIKTKIIIGLTNKTYDEVIEDDSTEALTQRFPISYKLQYELTKLQTASLVINRYPNFAGNKIAAMMETIGEMNSLTPRKVLEMAKYIKDLDIIKTRDYSEKITNNAMVPVINYLKYKYSIDHNKLIFNEIVKTRKDIREELITDYDSLQDISTNLRIVKNSSINNEAIDSKNIAEINDFLDFLSKKAA
jgi:MoxR-like ATPase/uncharacterized protein YfkK (UPF0435 family)